jgi:hypothetical protein
MPTFDDEQEEQTARCGMTKFVVLTSLLGNRGLIVKIMKLSLGSVAIVCGAISAGAFAAEPPKEVGSLRQVKIIDISSIKKISENIGADAIRSTMEVEFEGMYEGHGALDNLVGQIETISSSDTGAKGELKIYSVDLKPVAMRVGGGFITALSSPTPFRVTVKVAPSMWSPSGNANFAGPQTGMEWSVIAKVARYTPVQYEHVYGFSAFLVHSAARKAWNLYPFGLSTKP